MSEDWTTHEVHGFLDSVLASGDDPRQGTGLFGWGSKSGSAPTPFDGADEHRLAGPDDSHPLAAVGLEELIRPRTGGLDGWIEVTEPVRMGEGIKGRLVVTAERDIDARAAHLRLVGVRLAEREKSVQHHDSEGRVTSSEEWIEVDGELFEEVTFPEPVLPRLLSAGQRFEAEFHLPAPRLGPPTAHLGTAVLAWALHARWDLPLEGDEHLACLVDVRVHPDFLRSGAAGLPQGSLYDAWQDGDATLSVSPLPPVSAGSEIDVTVSWPSAGSGRGGRLELQADIEAPNGISGLVVWSAEVDPSAFRAGSTFRVPIPADAPPTCFGDGVGISYRLRALIDRPFRADVAVERAIAVI